MEVNALASWQSIGRDLYALGSLEKEIARAKRAHQRHLTRARHGRHSGSGHLPPSLPAAVAAATKTPRDGASDGKRVPSVEEGIMEDSEGEDEVDITALTRSLTPPPTPGATATATPRTAPTATPAATGVTPAVPTTADPVVAVGATSVATPLPPKPTADNEPLTWASLTEAFRSPLSSPQARVRIIVGVYRLIRRFGKGFLLGWGVKALFGQLSAIIRSRGQSDKLLTAVRGMFAPQHFRMGAFVGGFLVLFQSIMRASRSDLGVVGRHRAILAGAAAASSLMFLPFPLRLSISLFFFVRALEVAAVALARNGLIPSFEHADVLVMGLASAQIIWSALFNRSSLDKGYLKFLDLHSGKAMCQKAAYTSTILGEAVDPKWMGQLSEIRNRLKLGPLDLTRSMPDVCCTVVHPQTSSCALAFLQYYNGAIKRALPVYIPVYLVPMILFRGRRILMSPLSAATQHAVVSSVIGIARSAFFLASYCAVGWTSQCYLKRLGVKSSIVAALGGFSGGCMVILEKKHRRLELALYVLTHALQAGWRTLMKWGIVSRIPYGEMLLFVWSMAVIMNAYIHEPKLIRPSYFRLVNFFFGSGEATWARDEFDIIIKPRAKPSSPISSPDTSPQHRPLSATGAPTPAPLRI